MLVLRLQGQVGLPERARLSAIQDVDEDVEMIVPAAADTQHRFVRMQFSMRQDQAHFVTMFLEFVTDFGCFVMKFPGMSKYPRWFVAGHFTGERYGPRDIAVFLWRLDIVRAGQRCVSH